MSSILTNSSSMTALETLRNINRGLQTIQAEIASGRKVSTAKDNAAVWSVGATMRSDVASFKTISDSLSVGSATVGVARSVAEKVAETLQEIKTLIVQAQDETVDKLKYQQDINEKTKLIQSYVGSAQFNGLNLLNSADPVATAADVTAGLATTAGDLMGVRILGSLNRAAGGTVTAAPIVVNRQNLSLSAGGGLANLGLLRVTAIDPAPATNDPATPWDETTITTGTAAQKAAAALNSIETMLTTAINAAARFGSVQNAIEGQKEFVMALVDSMNIGVGALTDTDMEAASAKLQALQVQQQLGIQSLSIANQAPQALLSLFR